MLSYQHGFHAGNRADVLKHAVLDAFLRAVADEPRPVLYIETHAGRGVYDLTGPQAAKGGEAESGIIPLMTGNAPDPLVPWLDLVRARGREAYPGSPALAQARLDGSSRLILFERHPQEHAALSKAMAADTRIQIRHSDGYAGALTLSPRAGEQVIVFVDPSYETRRYRSACAVDPARPQALAARPRYPLAAAFPGRTRGRYL
jgi:23S rRNA (adenine2030-N6)-methyltransferase